MTDADLPNNDIRDLYKHYTDFHIDGVVEQSALRHADLGGARQRRSWEVATEACRL